MKRTGRVMSGAMGFIGRLNPRERALLVIMALVFVLLIAVTFFIRFRRSLTAIEEEIATFEAAIDDLTAQGADFASRIRQAEAIEEQLKSNEVQLHSFLERECLAAGVEPPSSYNDTTQPLRDSRTGQARITEVSTVCDINAVSPLPLNRLLQRIASTQELVVLKAVEIQPARGSSEQYRVRLTVSTYREDRQSREAREGR